MKQYITFFNPSTKEGYSINKVSSSFICLIDNKINIRMLYFPKYRINFISILKIIRYTYINRNKHGINHITGGNYYATLGLLFKKIVITIHDVGPFDNNKGLKKIAFGLFWFAMPTMIANKVVCVSDYTKKQLIKGFPFLNNNKICVIPNAIDKSFSYKPKVFNKKCPTILCIGTAEHKNIIRTIKALRGINCHLRIVGIIDNSIKDALSGTNYSNVYNLSNEEILKEYENCDIVSFISLYEGFGMPVIEGQATGRVVITSNISPMKDIAGDGGAVFTDPYSIEDIKDAFRTIINDKELRSSLINTGLKNIIKYKPENIAKAYENIYNSLLYDK